MLAGVRPITPMVLPASCRMLVIFDFFEPPPGIRPNDWLRSLRNELAIGTLITWGRPCDWVRSRPDERVILSRKPLPIQHLANTSALASFAQLLTP